MKYGSNKPGVKPMGPQEGGARMSAPHPSMPKGKTAPTPHGGDKGAYGKTLSNLHK